MAPIFFVDDILPPYLYVSSTGISAADAALGSYALDDPAHFVWKNVLGNMYLFRDHGERKWYIGEEVDKTSSKIHIKSAISAYYAWTADPRTKTNAVIWDFKTGAGQYERDDTISVGE